MLKEKWKYVLKIALIYSILTASFIQLLNFLFGELTSEFENGVEIVVGIIGGTIIGTLIVYPFAILLGLIMWKNKNNGKTDTKNYM